MDKGGEDKANHESRMLGQRIGPWRVERLINRGGMGAVYMARRVGGGFQQQVALKLLRPGMDTWEVTRRFEQERQILAGLEHPNIARLLDGGATEDGQPWLAMEYVKGEPIDRWCDAHRQTIEQRVALTRKVCEAVQFAHQNLVVHRDLKPSNILVTDDGEPKLLDFGIAKLLQPQSSDQAETATAYRLLTPDYASPEQVRGGAITSATDVYALGVLFYQLLAGTRPYEVDPTAPQEMFRVVCEATPATPSAALKRLAAQAPARILTIAEARQTKPERLMQQLRGDLDTITMTALRKQPVRRYAAPGAMSEDLKRMQDGLPIAARKDTLGYRTRKFVRRNTVPVAAAALVLVALIGGLGAALWQAQRATDAQHKAEAALQQAEQAQQLAEARFNDVRELANTLIFDVHDAIAPLPGSTRARQILVNKGLIYLEKLSESAGQDAELLDDLAGAYLRIGDAQGSPGGASLGNLAAAMGSYQKAVAIRQSLAAGKPEDAKVQAKYAVALNRLANGHYWQNDLEVALDTATQALAVAQKAQTLAPDNTQYPSLVAGTHASIASILAWQNQYSAALDHYDQAIAIRQTQLKSDPSNPELLADLAQTLTSRAQARSWENPLQALPEFRRGVSLAEQALQTNPGNRRLQTVLTNARLRLSQSLSKLGLADEAIAVQKRNLQMLKQAVAVDPNDARAVSRLAQGHKSLGNAYLDTANYLLAEQQLRTALELSQGMALKEPGNPSLRGEVAENHYYLGLSLIGQSRFEEAREQLQSNLQIRLEMLKSQPRAVKAHRSVAGAYVGLGDLAFNEAIALSRQETEYAKEITRAREYYRQGLNEYAYLSERGLLPAADQAIVENVNNKLKQIESIVAEIGAE